MTNRSDRVSDPQFCATCGDSSRDSRVTAAGVRDPTDRSGARHPKRPANGRGCRHPAQPPCHPARKCCRAADKPVARFHSAPSPRAALSPCRFGERSQADEGSSGRRCRPTKSRVVNPQQAELCGNAHCKLDPRSYNTHCAGIDTLPGVCRIGY